MEKMAVLTVRVQPNARENKLVGFKDGILQIRIAAPPVEGKANEALIKFLSGRLDVPKSRLSVKRGLSGRTKTILVSGLEQSQLEQRLAEASR